MSSSFLYNALKAIKPLRALVRRARDLRDHYFRNVWLLTGRECHSGEPIRVFCAGQLEVCRYIERLVFQDGSCALRHRKMWSRKVLGLFAKTHVPYSLIFVQTNVTPPPGIARYGAFVIPSWLAGELDVAYALTCQRGNDSVKTDLRNIRKNGFTYRVTQDPAEIECFYQTMYLPYIRQTHGGRAFVTTREELAREAGQGGELLLVEQDARPVAGVYLGTHDADRLDALELGVVGGDRNLVKLGALAAIYYFAIQLAAERHHKRLYLGGARPFLNDGALQYKNKWGLRITGRLHTMPDRLLFQPRLGSAAIHSFLRNNPFVFENDSAMHAAVFVDSEAVLDEDATARFRKVYCLQGLAGVSVYRLSAEREAFTASSIALAAVVGAAAQTASVT
jgi:hypothetical protein